MTYVIIQMYPIVRPVFFSSLSELEIKEISDDSSEVTFLSSASAYSYRL